jgi:hypothetical protein
MKIATVGLDLAKTLFQVHGVDSQEHIVVRKQLRRAEPTARRNRVLITHQLLDYSRYAKYSRTGREDSTGVKVSFSARQMLMERFQMPLPITYRQRDGANRIEPSAD